MVGGEGVLGKYTPEGNLAENFRRQAQRIVDEINTCVASGTYKIARDLIADSPRVFGVLAPGKSAEIQAELSEYLNSLLPAGSVEQPQVSAEATPPLKQVSEAEATPQIAACTTIDQVAELIINWQIPVSPQKIDDNTKVAREPVPGDWAVSRMRTLVDLIIKATDNRELDEVVKRNEKLVPRFGGLRERVKALARAERTRTIELPTGGGKPKEAEPEVPESKLSPDAISFGGMFNQVEDMLAVATAARLAPSSIAYLEKKKLVPNEINQDEPKLILALANRAVAKEVLVPLRDQLLQASREKTQHGAAYEKAALELSSAFAKWTESMLRGQRPSDSFIYVEYPRASQPEKAKAQVILLIERVAQDLKPFVTFSTTDFGLTATLRGISTDEKSNATPIH